MVFLQQRFGGKKGFLSSMIERIEHNDIVIAIIIRNDFAQEGISFVTPNHFSQQLAFMKHPQGKVITAHVHNHIQREVLQTKETLFIKKGVLRVDFYTDEKKYLESTMLFAGDVILLASGGHGFEVIEPIEMVEVKQGPYAGEHDKTCFAGVKREELIFKKVDSND